MTALDPIKKERPLFLTSEVKHPLETEDLLVLIFQNLHSQDLLSASAVNQYWRAMAFKPACWVKLSLFSEKRYPKPENWSMPFFLSINHRLLAEVKAVSQAHQKGPILDRISKVYFENIDAGVLSVVLDPESPLNQGEPSPIYGWIPSDLTDKLKTRPGVDILNKIATQVPDFFARDRITLSNFNSELAEKWWCLVKSPTDPFFKWINDNRLRSFSIGGGTSVLNVDDASIVDRVSFNLLVFGAEEGEKENRAFQERLNCETAISNFILNLRTNENTVCDPAPFHELVGALNRVVPHLRNLQIDQQALDNLIQFQPVPRLFTTLYLLQNRAPWVIVLLHQIIFQYRPGSLLEIELNHWIENRAALVGFCAAIKIDGVQIALKRPLGNEELEWANQALTDFETKQVLSQDRTLQPICDRLRARNAQMELYLNELVKGDFPNLYQFLKDCLIAFNPPLAFNH